MLLPDVQPAMHVSVHPKGLRFRPNFLRKEVNSQAATCLQHGSAKEVMDIRQMAALYTCNIERSNKAVAKCNKES